MARRVLLSQADVSDIEETYVLRALRSGWVAPLGPDVDAFEHEVAERVGVRNALALTSGTAALHLALLGLGAAPGKTVVLPTMTFAASANAVKYTGAEPIFVDCLPEDGNIDPELLIGTVDTLLAQGKEISAVMTVDLFGRACDYSAISPALKDRGVPLVEDAAEALGAFYDGTAAGSFGQASALSFNGNKIMTTSGGGMLLSDDDELVALARKRSTQSREQVPWYEHVEVGYNYRLSNLLAALGRAQLTRLDGMIERRKSIRLQYIEGLSDLPVRFLGSQLSGTPRRDNYWLTTLVLENHTVPVDEIVAQLNKRQIEARHLWKPMHLQPVYSRNRIFGGAVGQHLFNSGLTLPSGSALTNNDIDYVIESLREIISPGA